MDILHILSKEEKHQFSVQLLERGKLLILLLICMLSWPKGGVIIVNIMNKEQSVSSITI